MKRNRVMYKKVEKKFFSLEEEEKKKFVWKFQLLQYYE